MQESNVKAGLKFLHQTADVIFAVLYCDAICHCWTSTASIALRQAAAAQWRRPVHNCAVARSRPRIDALQAEASKWAEKRDAYAQESQKASGHTAEMQAAAEEASQQLDRLKAEIAQAKKHLLALER